KLRFAYSEIPPRKSFEKQFEFPNHFGLWGERFARPSGPSIRRLRQIKLTHVGHARDSFIPRRAAFTIKNHWFSLTFCNPHSVRSAKTSLACHSPRRLRSICERSSFHSPPSTIKAFCRRKLQRAHTYQPKSPRYGSGSFRKTRGR